MYFDFWPSNQRKKKESWIHAPWGSFPKDYCAEKD